MLHLPLKNLAKGLSPAEYATYHSEFRAERTDDGIFKGMPKYFNIIHNAGPILVPTVDMTHDIKVLARFTKENTFINGYAVGEDILPGTPVALKVPNGGGEIFLLSFNPEFRMQQDGTFKVLYNLLF